MPPHMIWNWNPHTSRLLLSAPMLVIILAFAFGCAPRAVEPTLKHPSVLTQEKPFGPTTTFQELVQESVSRQHSPVDTLFDPDIAPLHPGLLVINRERPMVALARDVTAFAGGPGFLAAGSREGDIRIWSSFPCPLVTLPQKEPVGKIWWDGQGPYLSASDGSGSRVYVYDLDRCARVSDIDIGAEVETMAVSSGGRHVALVDRGGRLWTGDLNTEPTRRETLRFAPLAVAFTPGEGVLMICDGEGWLVLWSTADHHVMSQTLVPGGPFAHGTFDGPTLILETPGHENTSAWDIPGSRPVKAPENRGEFVLGNGVLHYVAPGERYVKKTLLSRPRFSVEGDRKQMVVRIFDLDGQMRYYCLRTGLEREKVHGFQRSALVAVSPHGSFAFEGMDYALADPVVINGDWVLWSRFIDGHGHCLWWTANPGLEKRSFTETLPHRTDIRKATPPEWKKM